MKDKTDLYSTTDLILAVVLIYFEFDLYGMNENALKPKQINFLFEKSEKLEKTISDFWNKKLKVEPLAFHSLLRETKGRIRESEMMDCLEEEKEKPNKLI